jgi:hypothetical protein
MLDGVSSSFGWEAASSNWVFGDIRGMVSNKGTDAGDQPDINPIQSFNETSTNSYLNGKWRSVYEAVARCNAVIKITATTLEAGTITQAQADVFVQQARALRGWYHFEAWRMWEKIPYVDENTDATTVTNSEDVRDKIIADLTEGTKLPENMGAIGKFNKTVSQVLLAKVMMQMKKDYAGALTILNTAKNGKKPNGADIGLSPKYGDIFDIANRNGIECVYTVQYSVNDGSGGNNAGSGEVLNFPYKSGGSPGGCCGFFQPTQEFVNSFRTSGGLPLLDGTYNSSPVVNDYGLTPAQPFTEDTGPLDPRLDWSVGRRGIPYWDWGIHTGSDWIRDQTYAGVYSPKKQVYKKSQEGQYTDVTSWTSGYTATTNAANYVINQYPAAGAPFDTKENARIALRMERKLELGQEGHRWYDLNRWGVTVAELTKVLTYEKTTQWGKGTIYKDAALGPEDVTFPIPQRQIDLSNGNIVQNR